MRSGNMDRHLTIQRLTYANGPLGVVEQWADHLSLWAEMKQESGQEFFAAATVNSERKVIFRIRWVDVTVLDRVAYGGRNYDINEVRELGRKAGIELHTTTAG